MHPIRSHPPHLTTPPPTPTPQVSLVEGRSPVVLARFGSDPAKPTVTLYGCVIPSILMIDSCLRRSMYGQHRSVARVAHNSSLSALIRPEPTHKPTNQPTN